MDVKQGIQNVWKLEKSVAFFGVGAFVVALFTLKTEQCLHYSSLLLFEKSVFLEAEGLCFHIF